MRGFDSNRERFEFGVKEVDWADVDPFRGRQELPLTSMIRIGPIREWALSLVVTDIDVLDER